MNINGILNNDALSPKVSDLILEQKFQSFFYFHKPISFLVQDRPDAIRSVLHFVQVQW